MDRASDTVFPQGGGRWVLPGLVLIALGARAFDSMQRPFLFNDAPRFISMARRMLEQGPGAALSDSFHPLTSLLMAGTSALVAVDLEVAGRVISVLSGGVAVIAVYLLARDLFGEGVGALAGLLFALHSRFIACASSVQSDGLHLALFAVGALAVWRTLDRRRARPALAAGVCCGLAYLTRPEGLAVATVLGIWLLADLLRRRLPLSQAVALGGVFALGLIVVAGPYIAAMRVEHGTWVLTQKKSVIEMLNIRAAVAGEIQQAEQGTRLRPARPGRVGIAARRTREAVAEVAVDGYRAIQPVFLLLAVIGVATRMRERRTLFLLTFVGVFAVLLFGLHMAAGYVSRRHWLGPAALVLPCSALGLRDLAAWAQSLVGARWRARLLPAAITLIALGMLVEIVDSAPDLRKQARKEAATWIARNHAPAVVAAHRMRDAHYAGARRYVSLPAALMRQSLVDQVRDAGADFLIVGTERLKTAPSRLHGAVELHRVAYPGGVVLVLALDTFTPPVGSP